MNNHKTAHNITFGYADSEDRLWARLLLTDQAEAKLWLTRKLCLGICQGICDMLEKYTYINGQKLEGAPLEKQLRTEYFEASRSTWDPTPPPPQPNNSTPSATNPIISLCHTAHIDAGSTWQLRFLSPHYPELRLPLDRYLTLKIFLAITQQAHKAGWNIQPTKNWLKV
jgi:hypothetical protein